MKLLFVCIAIGLGMVTVRADATTPPATTDKSTASQDDRDAQKAALAELAEAQKMADAAIAAASGTGSSSAPAKKGATQSTGTQASSAHHSMGELVLSAKSFRPANDSSHHTMAEFF